MIPHRPRLHWATVVAIVVAPFILVGLLFWYSLQPRFPSYLGRVEPGMTLREVTDTLGPPNLQTTSGCYPSGGRCLWLGYSYPQANGAFIDVQIGFDTEGHVNYADEALKDLQERTLSERQASWLQRQSY